MRVDVGAKLAVRWVWSITESNRLSKALTRLRLARGCFYRRVRKLAKGKRTVCDITKYSRDPKPHAPPRARDSTARTRLRRRVHRAGDRALAGAFARRTPIVTEDARSLCPRPSPMPDLPCRTFGHTGGVC